MLYAGYNQCFTLQGVAVITMNISQLFVKFAVMAAILVSIVCGHSFVKVGSTQPPGCTSTIAESERVDCASGISMTEGICR